MMRTLSKGDNGSGVTRQMLDKITEDADSNFAEPQASITESQKQPYSPALTELTLSELSALVTAGTLIRGRQYYVTDEKWLLIAMDDSTLKPVSGRLTIENGDTLPTGIEPDVLLIDTGAIEEYAENVIIAAPTGYYLVGGIGSDTVGVDDGVAVLADGNAVLSFTFAAMPSTVVGKEQADIFTRPAGNYSLGYICAGNRLILEFHRSEL